MNPELWKDWYCEPRLYVHSWPGMAVNRGSCKHSAARKARFKARHK